MSEATRTRAHAPEVRQRAVEILQEGVGHRALAAKLGIPQATARQWARAYAVGGADAVLNAGARHHTYSYDVKKGGIANGMVRPQGRIFLAAPLLQCGQTPYPVRLKLPS